MLSVSNITPLDCPLQTASFLLLKDHAQYRWFRVFNDTRFARVVHIVHVRNPLDILVSAYFSYGWMHSGAEKNEWIRQSTPDEYALRERESLLREFDEVFDVMSAHDPAKGYHVHLVSYEQMVYAFRDWIADVVRSFDFSSHKAEAIAVEALWTKFSDNFSAAALSRRSETAEHRRAIVPGNHRVHLNASTIAQLERDFARHIALVEGVVGNIRFDQLYPQSAAKFVWSDVRPPP